MFIYVHRVYWDEPRQVSRSICAMEHRYSSARVCGGNTQCTFSVIFSGHIRLNVYIYAQYSMRYKTMANMMEVQTWCPNHKCQEQIDLITTL